MLLLASGLTACEDREPSGPSLNPDDCLKAMTLASLPAAIKACDAVIQAYPKNPLPLKDRALLWSLKGDDIRSCNDLVQARGLARRLPASASNRRILEDLEVSLRSCRS